MVDFDCKDRYGFSDLVEVVRLLRGPGGCPWDAEQTHESIRRNFLEETCEACEAIDLGDSELLCEELGDVLLQVLFHTSIESDAGRFTLDDVCDRCVKKLVFRHPHVFGAAQVSDSQEVLTNWDNLKRVEKGQQTYTDTLRAVSRALPGLWRGEKVQKKAEKAGLPGPETSQAVDLLQRDLRELAREAQSEARPADPGEEASLVQERLGDLLFDTVALSRALGIDPEDALNAATDRFTDRFQALEQEHPVPEGEPLPGDLSQSLWPRS